jgi:hypothetical protein
MGEGVIYKVVEETPVTINNHSITLKGRNYELVRSYINRGVRHFVAEMIFGNKKVDFIVKGKNALICEY